MKHAFASRRTVGLSALTLMLTLAFAVGCRGPVDAPLAYIDVIAANQPRLSGVAVHGDRVYWTNRGMAGTDTGTVMWAPKTGGEVSTLAQGQSFPEKVVAGSAGVFWASNKHVSGAEIFWLPTEGAAQASGEGTVLQLTHGQDVRVFALHGDTVYWANTNSEDRQVPEDGINGDGAIRSLEIGASSPVTIATGRHALSLAVNDTDVFWSNESAILRAPRVGGDPVVLAAGQSPRALSINGTHVFWTNAGAGKADDTIRKVPLQGGGVITVAEGLTTAYNIVAAGEELYFTQAEINLGTLASVPTDGGDVREIAAPACGISKPAVDDTSVYWTCTGYEASFVLRSPR